MATTLEENVSPGTKSAASFLSSIGSLMESIAAEDLAGVEDWLAGDFKHAVATAVYMLQANEILKLLKEGATVEEAMKSAEGARHDYQTLMEEIIEETGR